MSKKPSFRKKGNSVAIILVVLGIGFAIGFLIGSDKEPAARPQAETMVEMESIEVSLVVEGTGEPIEFSGVELEEGAVVMDLLSVLERKGALELETKDFGDELGMFIEEINGERGGGKIWWQFWVDGNYSQVGVSFAKLQDDSVVEFKLSEDQFIRE